MKTFKMSKYADDTGRLVEPADAEFIARKLAPDDEVDFTGITDVSAEFLNALFTGQTPATLDSRLTGMSGSVEASLAAWQARTSVAPTRDRSVQAEAKAQSKPQVPQLEFTRPDVPGEQYTPTRLVNRLRRQLSRYIESAYPLSDPVLVRARRRLLEDAAGGTLLGQDPYVETTPRYRAYKGGYENLGLPPHTASFFARLASTSQQYSAADPKEILYPGMYVHQAEAYKQFLVDHKDLIVATGTGSGKTECFLIPLLGMLYEEAVTTPETFRVPGVRALILYPMNALVNDQLARLRLLFGDEAVAGEFRGLGEGRRHPRFGMYTGRTPYPGPRDVDKDRERVGPLLDYYHQMNDDLAAQLRRLGRYPAKDLEAFAARDLAEAKVTQTGKNKGKPYTRHNFDKRLHTQPGDRELLTRQEMIHGVGTMPGDAPDILVTNYSMLEYMLMRPFERPLFEQTRDWLSRDGSRFVLVLDEAHMYRGAKGAEVAFLLRRLRARLGITDRPDKLRVIATSASLGTKPEAIEQVRRFAADLTGKTPADFSTVTGHRDIPTPATAGNADLASALATVDLDALHSASTPDALRAAVQPIMENLGGSAPVGDEIEILKGLHDRLAGHPVVNMLLRLTSGTAQPLRRLAESMFPGAGNAVRATETLLTLGAVARRGPEQPGLVPTRIHLMFRGLHAIYACLNPKCLGRQDRPGEPAILGKLFTEPRTACDACGCRVFELASCRACGSPYLLAYCPDDPAELDFLWGETEGNLTTLQLLPSPPRYAEAAEEIQVHLRTGYVDRANGFPQHECRPLWVARPDAKREATFSRCAMCQPPGTHARARITDFRTKGEQPFTALIETQFSEQPPQKHDVRLPNRGRKVLVFSDGRQKAARLAPALEHSHARDMFRQVLAIGAEELTAAGLAGMNLLYPAVLRVCNDRGLNLFPSPDEAEFQNHILRAKGRSLPQLISDYNHGFLRPTVSYARGLFSELTDRYYSIYALALASIEEHPVVHPALVDFPDVGLSKADQLVLVRLWVRQQLESRRFLPPGADPTKLGDDWEVPEGIDPTKPLQVVPRSFAEFLRKVLGDVAARAVEGWFPSFVRSPNLFRFENNRYFLSPDGLSLRLRLDAEWLLCRDCARVYPETLLERCPACLGRVSTADTDYLDAQTGFYRDQVLRAVSKTGPEPFGLVAAEHSAQLTGRDDQEAFNKTEKYELRFQDIPVDLAPPIDVLSCTTTMEVGIDIGTLSGVALRNVPPHVANYQQRAGRAGRRGRAVASVVTYAHGTSHDAYYFDHPEAIIAGDVRAPIVYVENQQVLRRHVNAYLIQRFFHERVTGGGEVYSLFESLGTVEAFLSGRYDCSLAGLTNWLSAREADLLNELRQWVPRHSYGLDTDIAGVDTTIGSAVPELLTALSENLPVTDYGRRQELSGPVREGLERQLEEELLAALVNRAVIPRYAFPTDVVNFWVSRRRAKGDPPNRRFFDYEPQRDLQIALSEYAPGASLTIDKFRFTSAAMYSPYEPDVGPTLDRARPYTACRTCGYMTLNETATGLPACPCCGGVDLFRQQFIKPSGFAPDVNEKREVDRGDGSVIVGRATAAQLEVHEPPATWAETLYTGRLRVWAGPQQLVSVNKGVGDRGFMVCRGCGRTEPVFGPGFTQPTLFRKGAPARHLHPMEHGVSCDQTAAGPYYLGHAFPTDILLLAVRLSEPVACPTAEHAGRPGRAGRAALTSLVEAVTLAASRTLQVDEGELGGNWCPVAGGGDREAYLFLYDLLPGGAGYTRLVQQNLDSVLTAADSLLAGCSCEGSCYSCLRHFGNTFLHPSLDRHLALALLRYIRSGAVPRPDQNQKETALSSLKDLLRLQGITFHADAVRGECVVPLVVIRPGGSEVWVDVRHPLVDASGSGSSVAPAAEAELVECCLLDTFTLRHDLPAAVAALQL